MLWFCISQSAELVFAGPPLYRLMSTDLQFVPAIGPPANMLVTLLVVWIVAPATDRTVHSVAGVSEAAVCQCAVYG